MAREAKQVNVGGLTYTIGSLSSTQNLKLAIKIAKLAGIPVAFILKAVFMKDDKGEDREVGKTIAVEMKKGQPGDSSETNKDSLADRVNDKLDKNFFEVVDCLELAYKVIERVEDEDAVVALVKEAMSEVSSPSGLLKNEAVFNEHFKGKLEDMLLLLIEIIKHEYQGFFQRLVTGLASMGLIITRSEEAVEN